MLFLLPVEVDVYLWEVPNPQLVAPEGSTERGSAYTSNTNCQNNDLAAWHQLHTHSPLLKLTLPFVADSFLPLPLFPPPWPAQTPYFSFLWWRSHYCHSLLLFSSPLLFFFNPLENSTEVLIFPSSLFPTTQYNLVFVLKRPERWDIRNIGNRRAYRHGIKSLWNIKYSYIWGYQLL